MRKQMIVILLLLVFLFPITDIQAESEQITPQKIIEDVVKQLDKIKDFKGTIATKMYLDDKVINSRTQIMKSESRSMTRNHGVDKFPSGEKSLLLNTIPWIYLPPDYETVKSSLPLATQKEYKNPLQVLDQLYSTKLLGESTYQERDVYIIELKNSFSSERLFVDQEYSAIRKIDIFNGSNIKVATINYSDFKLFIDQVWLPTKITVVDSVGQSVVEVNYQDWQVNLGLTDFDFLEGFETDYQTKIDQLKEELEDNSQQDELYLELSDLYKENGDIEKAISSLEEAIMIEDKIKYRKSLAEIYREQGDYDNALGEINAGLQLNYDDAELHYLLGEIQLQLGNTDQARQYLEKAVSYDSGNKNYLEQLFWVYKNLANKSDDIYMLERAERTINKLIEIDSDNKDYWIYLGDIYFEAGKTIKAADAYNQAVELAPKNNWAYIKLANYHQQINNYEKAEELYRYVIYLEDSLENHKRLADLYFEQKKYSLALEEYQTISNRAANDIDIKLKLAETYIALEKADKALEIFNQVLKDKEDDELYSKITKVIEKYRTETALEIIHQLLQEENILTNKQRESLYQQLGDIYFQQIKQNEQQKIEEIIPLDSQAEIYSLLAKIEFSSGNLEDAIHYFRRTIEEQPKTRDYYDLAVSYLLTDEFYLAREQAQNLINSGAIAKGEEIEELSYDLSDWERKYSDSYVPGRINLIEGNQLRQKGNFSAAKVEYQAAISENYEYQPPYFYLSVIHGLIGNDVELKISQTGVEDDNLDLLNRLISVINRVKV
ncbi:MAG: tetratricopeptide repeat protein [Bacillota bacterium]